MREIIIPETINVTVLTNNGPISNPLSFLEFFERRLYDQQLGKSVELIAMVIRVLARAKSAASILDVQLDATGRLTKDACYRFRLEESEWAPIAAATRNPASPYNPEIAAQIWPYFSAILDAPLVDP